MSPQEAAQLVREALGLAVAGDHEGASDRLAALQRDSDTPRMYGVCGAIAADGRSAAGKLFGGRVPDLAAGERWYVIHLRPPLNRIRRDAPRRPWHLFSERFLVAFFNGDEDTTQALFRAALTVPGDHYVRCVAQLFADVVGLSSMALKHVEEQAR